MEVCAIFNGNFCAVLGSDLAQWMRQQGIRNVKLQAYDIILKHTQILNIVMAGGFL